LAMPVTALLSVLTAAVAIRYTGAENYGYISLVAQLTMLLPFADLGLGAAVTRAVAQAKNDPSKAAFAVAIVNRSMRILLVVGVTGGFVSCVVGVNGGWSSLFNVPADLANGTDLSTSAVLTIFFLLLPLAISQRVLIGLDRSALLVVLGLVPPLLNLVTVSALISLQAPPMGLALGTSVASLVFLLVSAYFAFGRRGIRSIRRSPTLTAAKGQGYLKHILISAIPMLLAGLGTALAYQSGRVVLSAFSTSESLAEYAIAFQLYLPLYSVIYTASTTLWPRFSVSLDRELWRKANFILALLGAAAGAGYLIFGPLIVGVISSGEVKLSGSLAAAMAALLFVQAANATQNMLLTSPSGLWVQAVLAVILPIVVIPLTIWLIKLGLGAASPAISAAAGAAFVQAVPGLIISSKRVAK
jgi:O-antigen/teichoic acid export membrane protein